MTDEAAPQWMCYCGWHCLPEDKACPNGHLRPERREDTIAKLRAELERVYGDLATRGNEVMRLRSDLDGMTAACTKTQDMLDGVRSELDEARAEIARLRGPWRCSACGDDVQVQHCCVHCGRECCPMPADGGQKTSEAPLYKHCDGPNCMAQQGGACVCGCGACLIVRTETGTPAIPPRAASGGEAKDANGPPERIGLCLFTHADGADLGPRLWYPGDEVRGIVPHRERVDYIRADIADDMLAALRGLLRTPCKRTRAEADALLAKLDAGSR
jgi:hypothetical protein